MATIIIALLFTLALCALAWAASVRLRSENRLPMQWSLSGDVTWSAPRVLALAFIPALAAFVFAALIALSRSVPPVPGQENMVIPTCVGIGITFLAIQLLHLRLVGWTLRRNGR